MSGFAWVTLATNDSYSLGALVLAHSLKQVGTAHQLAVLVTPGVSAVMREKLAAVFNVVKEVNILDSRDEANLRLLKRPELGITFTKLHCWRLTQFQKCVFLDADTFVLKNADELFEREELSAAPDVGWPDCFNSGVFVYQPSEDTYSKLVQFALEKGSFDGGDQGLLNLYFSDWAYKDISKHLPFIYNMCSTACYSYLPAFKQFGGNAKIVHFIGNAKPWLQYFDTETRQVHITSGLQHLGGIVQQWWNIFCTLVHPSLSPEMTRSSAVHYANASSHSSTRPVVPFLHNLPSHSNTNQPMFTDDLSHQENKFDYKNVWDPWDDYEKSADETYNSHNLNLNKHIEYSQNYEQNPNSSELVIQNQEVAEVSNFSNISTSSLHVEPSFESQSHNNENETKFENNQQPQNVWTDESSKAQESEYFVHSQPAQESFNNKSQTTIAQNPPDCNQLAWPHECEPVSCVTNENALHDKPNEVHDGDAGLAGAFAQLTLGVPRTAEQSALEDHLRRQGWEVGNIDYMGRDSFDNIWSKICETLASAPSTQAPVPTPEPTKTAETPAPVQSESAPAAPIEQVPEPVKPAELEQTSVPPQSSEPSKEVVPSKEAPPAEPTAAEPVKAVEAAPAAPQPAPAVPEAAAPVATQATPAAAPAIAESVPVAPAEAPAPALATPAAAPAAPVEAPAAPEVPVAPAEAVAAPPEVPVAPLSAAAPDTPVEVAAAAPSAPASAPVAPSLTAAPAEPATPVASAAAPTPVPVAPVPAIPEPSPPAPEAAVPPATAAPVAAEKPVEAAVAAEKPVEATVAAAPSETSAPPKPDAPKPAEAQQKSEPPSPKPETPKAESPKPETPKAEAPKPEIPKAEAPKPETPKVEAPKPEIPKAEAPKPETPKAEAPKPEIPKADAPKPETPKADVPKPETPKSKTPKSPETQSKPQTPTSPKPEEAAAAAPAESSKPEAKPQKSQPKAAPKESSGPASPAATQKAAPKKAASTESAPAPEKPSAEEGAAGAQGPTPPPRKTGGGAGTKKTAKGKK